jgi:hypothetical protein
MVLDLPAMLKTNGTIHDTPRPTIAKPMAAGTRYGSATELLTRRLLDSPKCVVFFYAEDGHEFIT